MNLSVIGLGKLGLPLAALHAEHSRVFGIDLNASVVQQINNGACPISEGGLEYLMRRVVRDKQLSAHTDFSHVAECEASLVIVPSPSLANGAFDADYVRQACNGIGSAIRKRTERHTVIICSTVMPGTCDTIVRSALEEHSGKIVGGPELGLVYSPEFIALGTVIEDMQFPDMILIGESDPESGKVYEAIARHVANVAAQRPPAYHMSLTSAEIAKISVNSYVTMKISFANALAELCEAYPGADAITVANAIGADRRIGRTYLKPGVAFGGPCFPRDNRAMRLAGEQVGVALPLTTATDEINRRQVQTMIDRIAPYGRKHIGILGLAYKPLTSVIEESFGVQLAQELDRRGYKVSVYDPHVKENGNERLFEFTVGWPHYANELISNEIFTIICTPDETFKSLFPISFSTAERQQALVYDCWGLIPRGPWDATNVIRIGRQNVS